MSFDRVIICIMALFAILGGLDRIFGNRLGLGKAFEEGISTMGPLALSMVGIMVLSPVLATLLTPVVTPLFSLMGADPAVFAGSILALDMGGAPLARELAASPQAAEFGGILIGSTLGATVSFTIPFAMSALSGEMRGDAARGILWGVVTIPFGVLLGGFAAGFSAKLILLNTLPVLLLSLLIALGLWKTERFMLRAFSAFGWLITALATIGLVAAGVETTTGWILIPGLGDLSDAFIVVGEIAIVLAGALPLLTLLQKLLGKPMASLGKRLKINETAVAGLVATLANSIAAFAMAPRMDKRGRIVNMAFAVSGAFVFGDHLAFTAGDDPAMVGPMIIGKLCAGILAILLALWATKKEKTL
ncbi:MAG: ethanolamine utilization protein EutH [Clostridia bacterium]|nr:ethanolamine utilization protein EutH [Clostridia bacterium]